MLARYFGERGVQVHATDDPVTVCASIEEARPDLILLDWVMPERSGLDVLREIRRHARFVDIPVIMLTARAEELDRVEGLLTGADDYVVKPFSLAELDARIVSVMRRYRRRALPYRDEYLEIDVDRKRLVSGGTPRTLSAQEWGLLELLLRSDGVVTRQQIVDTVWGPGFAVTPRAVDVMVARLRRAMEPEPEFPRYLLTERGTGYRFCRRRDRLD